MLDPDVPLEVSMLRVLNRDTAEEPVVLFEQIKKGYEAIRRERAELLEFK